LSSHYFFAHFLVRIQRNWGFHPNPPPVVGSLSPPTPKTPLNPAFLYKPPLSSVRSLAPPSFRRFLAQQFKCGWASGLATARCPPPKIHPPLAHRIEQGSAGLELFGIPNKKMVIGVNLGYLSAHSLSQSSFLPTTLHMQ
jgi:hypothetical protein